MGKKAPVENSSMLGWPLGQVKHTSLCFYTMRADGKFDEIFRRIRRPGARVGWTFLSRCR
jgi:hypothetical protein